MISVSRAQQVQHLREANAVARRALDEGRHPFGAILVGPDGAEVLLRQGNAGIVDHAELTLARRAAEKFEPSFLAGCTLYTNFEPCAMCAGSIYWAGIGSVVYGASEAALLRLTGNHPENPTLSLPCREVFARGQRKVEVFGPFSEVEREMLELHRNFWEMR
jgi:tRNA(Arg) A34 adenosine deaminase TadA